MAMSPEEWLASQNQSASSESTSSGLSPEEWLKSQESKGSPITETGGGAALLTPKVRKARVEPTGQETSIAEKLFGKGTPESAGLEERVKKIGETSAAAGLITGGAKAAAPYVTAAGERLLTMPGALPKAAGGALVAGGTLASGITPQTILGATAAGAGSESIEQIASSMGADRATQVALGMGGGTLAQLATEYPKQIANMIGSVIKNPLKVFARDTYDTVAGLISGEADRRASKLRTEATDKAKSDLLAGNNAGASTTLDKALTEGIAEKQKAKLAEAQLAKDLESKRIEALRGVKTQQANVEKQTQEQITKEQGAFAPKTDEERLATNLQSDIIKTQEPIVEARATEYKNLLDDAFTSARQKQEAGQYWQTSEGGQKVKDYWQNRIDKGEFTASQQREIKNILDDIYSGGANGTPKDINAIDSWIRDLADKANYGKEVEGIKAMNSAQARELRKTITEGVKGKGGVYEWEPKFGEAKGLYSEKSDLLKAWDTKSGRAALSDETKVLDLPKKYFNSRQGYDDLVRQLGGDEAKAGKYASDYVATQLEGKTPAQIDKWLSNPKNGWVDKVSGLRQKITGYAEGQTQLAGKAERAVETQARLEKQIPKLEEAQKQWNKSVDDWAQNQYKEVINNARPGDAFANIMLSTKKPSETQLKALSTYIGQNPEARAVVPDAVRSILAKEKPSSIVKTFDERIAPTLQATGLIKRDELDNIRAQAIKIYQADAKDYTIAKEKKLIKAIDFINGAIGAKFGQAVTPTPQGEQ